MELAAVAGAIAGAVVALALFFLLCCTVYIFIQHRRYSHIPSPKGAWFFFGHAPLLASKMKEPNQYFSKITFNWHKEFGPVYVLWLMHKALIMTTDPDHVKEMAKSCISKPEDTVIKKGWGGRFVKTSLFLMQHYDEWKGRRRAFEPGFARSNLKELVPVFNKAAKSVIEERMSSSADGKTVVDLKEVFYQVAFQIISQVGFGRDFSKDPFTLKVAGSGELHPVLENVFDGLKILSTNPFAKYLFPWQGRKYAKSEHILRAVGRNCVEQRIRAVENKEDIPQDILTHILGLPQTDENVGIEEMVDEFLMFYLAGQETTSNLLSFTLILLLKHPDILHRLMEEVDEVVGDKETVDAGDLENLKYMQQVLQEALRLYPPATAIARSSPPDFVVCGKTIPAGSIVVMSTYSTHRSEEYYANPEMFDPDRFDLGQKRPSPYSYLPFGVGPRTCLGKIFAIMQAKVVLCHLLRSFDLFLPEEFQLTIKESVALSPANGIPCTFTAR